MELWTSIYSEVARLMKEIIVVALVLSNIDRTDARE